MESDELFGVGDVASELGLSEADVRQWARTDGGVARIGTTWVFRPEDVERLAVDVEDECGDDYSLNRGDEGDDDEGDDDEGDDDEGDDDEGDDDEDE